MASPRPHARVGAQDTVANFDSAEINSRGSNRSGNPYYPIPESAADRSIVAHEILWSKVKNCREGDSAPRVFSSLNGLAVPSVVDAKKEYAYAGVAVTDFVSQPMSAYAPLEGSSLTITRGGLNTLHSPAEALKPGDFVQVDFPTRRELSQLATRRGVSRNKVTAVLRRYKPYCVGKRVVDKVREKADKWSGPADTTPNHDRTAEKTIMSHLVAAVRAKNSIPDIPNAANMSDDEIIAQLWKNNTEECKKACKAMFGSKGKSESLNALANAVTAFAEAEHEEKRFVIGVCVQGCKKGGYAGVVLGNMR